MGRGCGLMVSLLALYSDNLSSNIADVYSFSVKLSLKRVKINQKEARVGKSSVSFWNKVLHDQLEQIERFLHKFSLKYVVTIWATFETYLLK